MSVLIPPLVLSMDLAAELELPVVNTAHTRTPAALHQVAEALVHQERYRKRDVDGKPGDETFCNFFVREALRMLGIRLPRMRANEFARHFRSVEALSELWTAEPLHVARDLAQLGRPVVAVQENPAGSGHVALLMPAKTQGDLELALKTYSTWIAQAGLSNFAYGLLRQGFNPTRAVQYFAHP